MFTSKKCGHKKIVAHSRPTHEFRGRLLMRSFWLLEVTRGYGHICICPSGFRV